MLTREKMQQMSKPKEREMPVPLLGESVKIKLFRKGDIDAMRAESMVAGEVDNGKFERLLLMRGLIEPAVDDAGYDELAGGNAAVSIVALFSGVVAAVIGLVLKVTIGLRVPAEGEVAGIDTHQHAEEGYVLAYEDEEPSADEETAEESEGELVGAAK